MRTARLIIGACLFFAFVAPASAHRLKLFATLEDGVITGYAFFVGSGRAHGADIAVTDESGKDIARFVTDETGAFSWKAPAAQTYKLTANTGDGHVAEAVIDRARFGGAAPDDATQPDSSDAAPAPAAPGVTQAQIERAVDAAVARQMRPLLEAYEAAEGRTRFNDVMGGVGMIVGLAGLALWASSRRTGAKS